MAQQARAGMKTRPLITSSTLWDVYRVGKRIAGYPTKAPVARFQILQWDNSTLEPRKIAHRGFSLSFPSCRRLKGSAGKKSKSPAGNSNSYLV